MRMRKRLMMMIRRRMRNYVEKDEDEDEKGKAMIRIVKVGIIISPYPKHASHFLFFPSQAEVSKSGVTI